MNWRSPHLWIGVMSCLAVVGLAAVDYGRTSPGPLSAVHQREDALQGRGGCADCHGGWTRSMGEACLDCHETVAEHIEGERGLHGGIGEETAMECAACHSDHHGARFQAVNRQSFARAGVADIEAYDHGTYGFPIGGSHDELGCVECHEHVDADVLDPGQFRYLGLEADCGACHDNPHEEPLTVSCAACHGQESFDVLGSHGHGEFLPLVGGHGDLDCAACHPAEGPHALRMLGTAEGDGVRGEPRGCLDCHETPHELEFERSVAREVGGGREGGCLHCHQAEHETFERGLERVTPELHALTGFLLDAPHTEVGCEECHGPEAGAFDARYPGRKQNQCGLCHDDPHGGQFEQGCVACHADTHFEPHTFTVEMHARGSFPLTGEHLDADCSSCHADPHEGTPRVFAGTTNRCDGCHTDAHDGFFEEHARKDVLAEIEADSCGVCHQTETFTDELASFDHGRSTGFPVVGAHAQEGCESCHPRAPEPDVHGRTLGLVHEEFGRFQGCETCHADPHEGAFDAAWCPKEVQGKQGCARCHEQTSFRVFPEGFDHHRWTRYRLDGAHAEADCSSCHAPLYTPEASGRTWGRVAGTSCADCHADPHGGQFALGFDARFAGPPKSCESCHSSASSFADLAFDHGLETDFPLGEAHRDLDCGACHPTEVIGGESLVRYRPLDGDCSTCHGTHDPARMKRTSPGRRKGR